MLGQLPEITDPNVLVGAKNADDAGVYRITDQIAVVLTTDFFTPIVDNPYSFGAIAAANSLSDVYAMGGIPTVALNIAMFPSQPEFFSSLKQIMQGGIDKMAEAGVSIIGGHTIKDKEPKYGFAVMGLVHPDKILDNTKARLGDSLILTKKIGTGVLSTGIKAGKCEQATIDEFTNSMSMLNKTASEIMMKIGVSTATDITGFGLIGHLNEVLSASGCGARLHSDKVPFFAEAVRLGEMGIIPGGTKANFKTYEKSVSWSSDVSDVAKMLMNDAQTSGGLLIFVPSEKRPALIESLQAAGILAAHLGEVVKSKTAEEARILVER